MYGYKENITSVPENFNTKTITLSVKSYNDDYFEEKPFEGDVIPIKPTKEDIHVMENFDLDKYMGEWYEVARSKNLYQIGCKNSKAVYTKKDDGMVKVVNICKRFNMIDSSMEGVAKKKDPSSKSGELLVSFYKDVWGEYNVLWTDYKNLAFVAGKNLDSFWILRRKDLKTEKDKKEICDQLDKLVKQYGQQNLNKEKLVWNDGKSLCK